MHIIGLAWTGGYGVQRKTAGAEQGLEKIEQMSSKIALDIGFDESTVDDISIALTELVNNAIHHANKDNPDKKVTVSFKSDDEKLTISILDEGTVGYLTSNLKNGHLRNIEHFKKYSFAMHGVYGVEGNFEIDGVWMWRGT